jgi:hypothetical protein
MFFGHSFTTIGSKSAISAGSLALGYMPWSLRQEQYGLVTASYSIELEGSQVPPTLLARADEVIE